MSKKKYVVGSISVVALLVASGLIVLNPDVTYLCHGDGNVYTLKGGLNETKPWIGYPLTPGKSAVTCKDSKGTKTAFLSCKGTSLCKKPSPGSCAVYAVNNIDGTVCIS